MEIPISLTFLSSLLISRFNKPSEHSGSSEVSRHLLQDKKIEENGARRIVKMALSKVGSEWYISDYRNIVVNNVSGRRIYEIEVFVGKKINMWNAPKRKILVKGILFPCGKVKIIKISTQNSKDLHIIRPIDTDRQTLSTHQREYATKHHKRDKSTSFWAPQCGFTGSKASCRGVDFTINGTMDKTQFIPEIPTRYRNVTNDTGKCGSQGYQCQLLDVGPRNMRAERQSAPLRCHSVYNSNENLNRNEVVSFNDDVKY